jgi:tetratricopeptide (TPR) repeat protein
LQAEQLLPLDGMAVPDEKLGDDAMTLDRLSDYSAIRLFSQCARRVQPDFELTAANQADVLAICRRVKGMPLGLVLAAAWLGTLTPAEIAAEIGRDLGFLESDMRDAPERQRSLRAAFNHSWRLLSQQEQAVFARLSVFRGGFERQAAQTVAGASLRDLRSLLHKALLYRAPNGRYEIHELLRQFAAEKLAEATAQSVRDRHSTYYCTFLSERTEAWHTAQQLETLQAVTQEADNIRQAWQWALAQQEWTRLLRAIDSWGKYHQWRGRYTQLEALCQAILKSTDSGTAAATVTALRLRIRAWHWLTTLEFFDSTTPHQLQQTADLLSRPQLANQDTRLERALILRRRASHLNIIGAQAEALSLYKQCLALFQGLGSPWQIAETFLDIGGVAWRTCQYDLALENIETALAIQQQLGDQMRQTEALNRLGLVHKKLGQMDEAERLHRDAVDLSQQLGYRPGLIFHQGNLAHTLLWQGKFKEALEMASESLAVCQELGYHRHGEIWSRCVMCDSLLHSGHYNQAHRQAEQALSILQELTPAPLSDGYLYLVMGQLALAESSYSQAQAALTHSSKYFGRSWPSLIGFPLAGLGHAACCLDQLQPARLHLAEALESALGDKAYITIVYILPFAAHFLAATGKLERGIELWALAQTQPFVANSKWFADLVGGEFAALTTSLPPEVVEADRERVRALDLWATAETLLAELD